MGTLPYPLPGQADGALRGERRPYEYRTHRISMPNCPMSPLSPRLLDPSHYGSPPLFQQRDPPGYRSFTTSRTVSNSVTRPDIGRSCTTSRTVFQIFIRDLLPLRS